MTRVRRVLLGMAAGIALAAGYSLPARAELPVIDTAALGQWAQQLQNDVKAYALDLQHYAGEVKSWATQNFSGCSRFNNTRRSCNNTPMN